MNHHMHPKGLRFEKAELTNKRAESMTKSLIDGGISGNGWHSWQDADKASAQCGLWVILNTKTHETYVQSLKHMQ